MLIKKTWLAIFKNISVLLGKYLSKVIFNFRILVNKIQNRIFSLKVVQFFEIFTKYVKVCY